MEPPSSGPISVVNDSGRKIETEPIASAVQVALAQHRRTPSEVTVLLTSDAHVQRLNRDYRALDEPTDVLTFVADEDASGDIAIAVPYAERQAVLRGVTLEQELGYLAIHGALHLAGFDDETEPERAQMATEMNRAAVAAGLPPDEAWTSLLHGERE
ncbi:MAG: rRNA maturation RNase YbeY [Fimbriimonas sp.]